MTIQYCIAAIFAFTFLNTVHANETSDSVLAQQNHESKTLPNTIACPGEYKHHVQGVCLDAENIYWSFTTAIVKTDRSGNLIKSVQADNHQGDLCVQGDHILVAVNLGPFNSPKKDADSWIYVFSKSDLTLLKKHKLPDVVYGAGGIKAIDDKIFVVGGLPDDISENYIYEYDSKFQFVKKHVLQSGHTHLGIQTVEFAQGKWWFGCYGSPSELLVADKNFQMIGKHKFNAALGITAVDDKHFYIASGPTAAGKHKAVLHLAKPTADNSLERLDSK